MRLRVAYTVSLLMLVHGATCVDPDAAKECTNEIQSFMSCVKQEVRYHAEIVGRETSPDFKKKVDQCFKSSQCPKVPSKEPSIESHMNKGDLDYWKVFRSWIEQLPTPKRQCLVDAVGDSYRLTLAECVRKFAPSYNLARLDDNVALPADVLKVLNERAYWRVIKADSFHDCPKFDRAAACIIELRRTEFPQSCSVRDHCAVVDTDNSGFGDCVNTCISVSEKCRKVLKEMREQVCKCQQAKRTSLVSVGQRKVLLNRNGTFMDKANQVAHIILYGERNEGEMAQKMAACGLNTPLFKTSSAISPSIARYILLMVDGYASRDIVYCHHCDNSHI